MLPDYERIILAMSIISLLPMWGMTRLCIETIIKSDKVLKIFCMMIALAISGSVLLSPLLSFLIFGKVFP